MNGIGFGEALTPVPSINQHEQGNMMQRKLIAGMCVAVMSSAVAASQPPEGAIRQGSLSNHTLIQDAMVGVAARVATQGCQSPEGFMPYVMALPQGAVGSRYWHETWVVEGCGSEFPIAIRFQEEGAGAATWIIE